MHTIVGLCHGKLKKYREYCITGMVIRLDLANNRYLAKADTQPIFCWSHLFQVLNKSFDLDLGLRVSRIWKAVRDMRSR